MNNSFRALKLFGYSKICSDIHLPDLPHFGKPSEKKDSRPLVSISYGHGLRQPMQWIHDWTHDPGQLAMSLGKSGSGLVLRVPHEAEFLISSDGGSVEVWPAPSLDAETLRHLLLDQVLPRILAHRGALVLHAGGIQVGSKCVAFLGPSGSGKSTLVGSFLGSGASILNDDGMVVLTDQAPVQATPTYVGLRLSPSVLPELFSEPPATSPMARYSAKVRISQEALGSTVPRSLDLAGIFVLKAESSSPEPESFPLSPAAACMAIVTNAFQLDLTDTRRVARTMELAAVCAAAVPVLELSYPREFAALPKVREHILEFLKSGTGDH